MLPIRNQNNGSPTVGRRILSLVVVALFLGTSVSAQSQGVPDISRMSIEELMNVEVTSVAKRPQRVADAAASVFVLTQEDIRRSGAASIPEALRMVPGLQVARIDENKWAIGSRGFNGRFDNKLLVLIDGRSVYTPLFSGVYWNVQDVMLEDVDRIEVIRGPGATLWGANAVNGVINIITKSAKATQRTLATAGGGTELRGFTGVRYGGTIHDDTYYRGYAKYFNVGASTNPFVTDASDNWDSLRAGFRGDWAPKGSDALTFQGDIYRSHYGETLTIPTLNAPYSNTFANLGGISGGNVLGRWTHDFGNSSTALQMYFDDTNITDNFLFTDHQKIFDIDFQHSFRPTASQVFIWGVGYRSIADNNGSSVTVSLMPCHNTLKQL